MGEVENGAKRQGLSYNPITPAPKERQLVATGGAKRNPWLQTVWMPRPGVGDGVYRPCRGSISFVPSTGSALLHPWLTASAPSELGATSFETVSAALPDPVSVGRSCCSAPYSTASFRMGRRREVQNSFRKCGLSGSIQGKI